MTLNHKYNTTLSLLMLLAVLFMGGLANQAWAEDTTKEIPVLTFSGNGYVKGQAMNAVAGQASFARPTLSVADSKGNPIRSRFKLSWEIVPTDGTATEENNAEGKRISVDPNTGSSVQTVYGVVAIGQKIGKFTVKVTATPSAKWASTYNENSAQYDIQVNAPTINFKVYMGDNVITTESTQKDPLTVYTYKGDRSQWDKTQVVKSMTHALPTMAISHELNGVTINDMAKYNITYSFAEGDPFTFDKDNTNFLALTTEIDTTKLKSEGFITGTLTITATPKDTYTEGDDDDDEITVDKKIYTTITYSVTVQVKHLNRRLKTYIRFVRNGHPQNEITHYRAYRRNGQTVYNYYAPEEMPSVQITDENGTDVTSAYVIVYGSNVDNDADNFVANEVYGQDVIHKYSKDPLDAYGNWAYYKNEKNEASIYVTRESQTNTDRALYRTTAGTNGKSACYQPDDYIVTAHAYVKKPGDTNLQTLGWWTDDDGTVPDYSGIYAAQPTTVTTTTKDKNGKDKEYGLIYNEDGTVNDSCKISGQLYDTDNANIYTGLESNQLVIHLLKRAAEIKFTPDPSTVTLANGVEMTPTNRFQVVGTLHDTTIDGLGIDSLKYDGTNANSFSYCIFIPDEDVYDGTEPEDGKVTVELIQGWSMVEDGTQIVEEVGPDGRLTGKKVEKTGKRYFSKLMWKNDDLRMKFHGKGYGKLYYNLIPWTPQNWDISQSLATVFTVADAEPTVLVVDPHTIYTALNTWSVPPSFKVLDQFRTVDLTEHFDFQLDDGVQWDSNLKNYWKDQNNHSEGANPDFGSYKPYQKGQVSIKVNATKKDGDTSRYSDPDNTETYVVITKDNWGEDTKATYEIIYEDLYSDDKTKKTSGKPTGLNDSESSSKMGKLHFIKAGSVYPGLQAYQEVPGINITFGSASEADNYTVTENTVDDINKTTADGKTTSLNDNSNDNATENGKVKRCLIEIPEVAFTTDSEGNVIPEFGYIRIDALTYGWLTIDGDFTNPTGATAKRYYTLTNLSTHTAQNIIVDPGEDKTGEYKFPTLLEAGQSYAFYCADGMQIHGINFDPAFINDNRDHDRIHSAISFQNGFTGNLPTLSTITAPTLSYYVRDNESVSATEVIKIASGKGYHAEVTPNTGRVTSKELTNGGNLTVANGAEVDFRVGVVGRVLGKDRTSEGLGQVEKRPHYNLFIGDMPTYIVEDGEAFDQGNRLSTTNIPTRIWMTIGGWEHGMSVQAEYPYYKNNDIGKQSQALADSWNEAKMDSTGRDNMTVDNFNYHSQGTQNPVDEKVVSYTSGKKNTFCVPVRGTYLKFEPEESGRLFVYVLQNGLTDLAADNASKISKAVGNYNNEKDGDYRLRRRAMYIIDETGQKVNLADGNDDWSSGMDQYLPGATLASRYKGYTYPNKNYYTEGLTRVAWTYDKAGHTLSFTQNGSGKSDYSNFGDDMTTIYNWWNRSETDSHNGYTGKVLYGPLEVLKLQDGSFAVPTKGYVRYTFKVKAGKVYYMFTTGSKLGFCGFGFLPEGYTGYTGASGSKSNTNAWIEQSNGDKSDDERSFAESVLDKLPEPTATEYSSTVDDYKSTDKDSYGIGLSSSEGTDGYIVLDASKQADADGSYNKLEESLKHRSFVNVKLKRNLYNKKWNGICLPFTVSEHQVKKVFGEDAQVITFDSIRGENDKVKNTVHFTRHVAQHMEAGRPYFIYPSLDDVAMGAAIYDGEIKFKHVSFENKDAMDVECKNEGLVTYRSTVPDEVKAKYPDKKPTTDSVYLYNVKGIYDCQRIPKWSYYMNAKEPGTSGMLKRLAPKTSSSLDPLLMGYNAFIYVYSSDAKGENKVSAAKRASFWLRGAMVSGEDNTTGIEGLVDDINVNQTAFVDGVYTLDGVCVRTTNSLDGLAPGVYIMGGRKYTVK